MSYTTLNANQYRRTIARPPVLSRLLLLWLILAIMAGAVTLLDVRLGISLLWGVSLSLLPSAVFSWLSLKRYGGASDTARMLRGVYRAEAFKFVLTAVLFAVVFLQEGKFQQGNIQDSQSQHAGIYIPVFFLAFIGGQIGSWLATAHALRRPRQHLG